ncbi:MAG: nitrogenase [Treponema sp.]|jgi:nitrogenase molybdenum-iron protein alpha chain|nr:nitrogenase [Treponema sp.]
MAIFNSTPEVEVRETRLHSILSYHGSAGDLYEKSKARSIQCVDRYYGQCSDCSEGCVSQQLAHIRDTALVYHAPIGCDAGMIDHAVSARGTSVGRGMEQVTVHLVSSNIREKDTIFGAAEKLRGAILEAHNRFHPKVIFVTSSCASGIIGEDIESITNEMESELGYPVVAIFCEGFKSRIWSTGFDAAFHGVLRKLVKPPKKRQGDLVNVFNFLGSNTFIPLLSKIKLRVNYLTALSSLEQLQTISEAACTTTVCETLSLYVASVLEEKFGVPEIKAPSPYGIDWTDKWLRAIGRATEREDAVEELIANEKKAMAGELSELAEKLKGKRLYVISGDSFAHNLANIGKSLGLELAGATTLHHDLHTDNPESVNTLSALVESNGDIPNFSVCNKQPYQMVKIIRNLKPDLLICRHPGLTAIGSKLGIPTLFEGDANYSIGYEGVIRMGRRFLEALRTKKLVENISRYVELPYTNWWLEHEDPFYFEGRGPR